MVEKKARIKKVSSGEKIGDEKKEIKASTGAWWKSAVPQETIGKPDDIGVPEGSSPVGEKESNLPMESEPVRSQRTGRKRSSRKGVTSVGESETDSPVQESQVIPKKRPPRKRPSKKTDKGYQEDSEAGLVAAEKETGNRIVSDVPPAVAPFDAVLSEQPAEETGTVAGGGGAEQAPTDSGSAGLTDTSSLVPVVEGTEKKRSGRSRRGRRGGKKNDGPKIQSEEGE
jgi:hypothetical protein